jgi:hypothetical protein
VSLRCASLFRDRGSILGENKFVFSFGQGRVVYLVRISVLRLPNKQISVFHLSAASSLNVLGLVKLYGSETLICVVFEFSDLQTQPFSHSNWDLHAFAATFGFDFLDDPE